MTALAILGGVKWTNFKALLKEIAEATAVTSDALDDDKLSDKEKVDMAKEWLDVVLAVKKLFGK